MHRHGGTLKVKWLIKELLKTVGVKTIAVNHNDYNFSYRINHFFNSTNPAYLLKEKITDIGTNRKKGSGCTTQDQNRALSGKAHQCSSH